MSTISREALLDAARQWRDGVRPELDPSAVVVRSTSQPLNPFPRFEQHIDLLLHLGTCGLWALPQFFRLVQSLRKDDPQCLSHPIKITAITLLTCGVWGPVAYVRIFMAIEGMRVRHKLSYHSSWLGYIIGFFMLPLPMFPLFLLQFRLNQSARDWGLLRERQDNPSGHLEAAARGRQRRFGFGVLAVSLLGVMGILAGDEGLSPSQELHQGKRIGGVLTPAYDELISWSPSDKTIRVSDADLELLWSHPMPTDGIPSRLERFDDGRLILSSHAGEIMVSSHPLEGSRPLAWRDLPVEPIAGFEILSGDRILTRDARGAVTLLDADGTILTRYIGLESKVKGAIELDSGIVLAWSKSGEIHSWRSDGEPRWSLDAIDWARDAEHDAIRSVLELDGLDLLCESRLGEIFILGPHGEPLVHLEKPESVAILAAYHLESGEIALFTRDGQVLRYSMGGDLIARSSVMEGKIIGTQALGTSAGGTREVAIWGVDGEIQIWNAREAQISQVLDSAQGDDGNDRHFRLSGLRDDGRGSLWGWTNGGEILRWEF